MVKKGSTVLNVIGAKDDSKSRPTTIKDKEGFFVDFHYDDKNPKRNMMISLHKNGSDYRGVKKPLATMLIQGEKGTSLACTVDKKHKLKCLQIPTSEEMSKSSFVGWKHKHDKKRLSWQKK